MKAPELTRIIGLLPREDSPDAALLERYMAGRDQLAFAGIVRRHGPMVWAVCSRVVRNVHDCEDAFQATFLLLVRKAGSIRRPELLGSWLHGVALRTALEARKARRKRAEKEKQALPLTILPTEGVAELRDVVDHEIARLPERYRAAVILCLIEGRTRGEVALQLGVAEGTVGSRLGRGKAILAKRLSRYGLPVGAVAAFLADNAAAAPKELVLATVAAAGLFARGGTVPMQVVILLERVAHVMFLTKLRVAAGALALTALLGAALGTTMLAARAPGEEPRQQKAGRAKVINKPKAKEPPAKSKTWTVAGACSDEHGKPLAGVRVVLYHEDYEKLAA